MTSRWTPEQLAAGAHRGAAGASWDALGELQLSFLRVHGLRPEMKLLDVGCGGLCGGARLAAFLDGGHYFGIDADAALLDAGYDIEIAGRGLQGRLPRANLLCDATFAARRFGVLFDMAIAHSLFPHLSWNSIRRCLAELAPAMKPGASFFATYYESPAGNPAAVEWVQQPGGVKTTLDRDPYHYRIEDLAACAAGLQWRGERLGEWGHPGGERMVRFERQAE